MNFAKAGQEAMKQVMLPLDRPTPEQLGFKPDSQNWSVYKRLLCGPLSNGEIIYEMRIANSTGRVSDVRKALRPYLMDVRAEADPVDRSRVVYRLAG
jgi:hypothetical protein